MGYAAANQTDFVDTKVDGCCSTLEDTSNFRIVEALDLSNCGPNLVDTLNRLARPCALQNFQVRVNPEDLELV